MAHDLNSLRKVAESARSIPGSMGLRRFNVYVVNRAWSGEYVGDGSPANTCVEILESGYPPKVRAMDGEEKALNGIDSDGYKVGPITPAWYLNGESGGVDFDTIVPSNADQFGERHYLISGGEFGNGKRMALKSVDYDRNFRYMLTLVPVESE